MNCVTHQAQEQLLDEVRRTTESRSGGEWVHTIDEQVSVVSSQGRYIFDSVPGFLRYASPAAAGGFGPTAAEGFATAGAFLGWVTQKRFRSTKRAGSAIVPVGH